MSPINFSPGQLLQELVKLFRRPGTWAVLMGAAIILPFLGSSGLWDPWETHYAEVARRMVVDGDWITPRWRQELFFSKPVFIFWMMAASFKLFGVSALAARLPFALVGILGVYLAYRLVARFTEPRKGLWAALVMSTSPFYFLIARQAITDIVFCVFLLGALACFFIVAYEEHPRGRDVWGIYIFAALAALAKTPVGLAIPFLVVLCYLLLTGEWKVLKKLKLQWGIPLFFLIAAPWYIVMLAKYQQKFFSEFFFHHNIKRAFTGVHGERSSFEYFIQQLGYGFFPWVALLPFAFGQLVSKLRGKEIPNCLHSPSPEPKTNIIRLELFLLVWFAVTFTTFTLMITKFHHYVFPALPPLAILTGLALAEREENSWKFLLPLGALILAMVANDLISNEAHISNLYTYDYVAKRTLPPEIYPRWWLFAISMIFGLLLFAARFVKARRLLSAGLGSLAVASTLVLAWVYQPAQGHVMSQEDLFKTQQKLAKPGEKFYQYQMNWRGEVFYSQDSIIKLSGEASVRSVIKSDKRVFILATTDSLAALNRASLQATGNPIHMLEGSNSRNVLLSNQLDPGTADLNPIAKNVFAKEPPISHPIRAEFEEGVALLGYDLEPESPSTGQVFYLTLYFQALKSVSSDYRIFVHIDSQASAADRIHGDHYPVDGIYRTTFWQAGDIIKDRFRLKSDFGYPKGSYTIYLGFYIEGKDEKYRMKVSPNFPQDGENRVRAGNMELR